jgi:hypothetical protein
MQEHSKARKAWGTNGGSAENASGTDRPVVYLPVRGHEGDGIVEQRPRAPIDDGPDCRCQQCE